MKKLFQQLFHPKIIAVSRAKCGKGTAYSYFVAMNQKAKIIGFHVLGWGLFFALVAAFVRGFGQSFAQFWALPFFVFVLAYAGLFYLNAGLLMPRLYLQKKYPVYFSIMLLLAVSFYVFKPFDRLVLHNASQPVEERPPFNGAPPPNSDRPPPPDRDRPRREPGGRGVQDIDIVSVVLFVAVWAASSVQPIVRQWQTSERRAARAEADKVMAELQFLKAQINPHFLFNTLNNIYSLAITKSEHTAGAVLKLSSILRYLTDDVRNDFVSLQSEVDCARDYIALQNLRLSKKVTVDFSVEGDTHGKVIPPLLFMTFIENAFKYGISNHEECDIGIRIRAAEQNVHFYCRNRIFPREEETSREGVGINNARKRLAYLYGEKQLLHINTVNGCFTVDLTVIS